MPITCYTIDANVTFENGTQAHYTCMLNVTDNHVDRFEISYNKRFGMNFVPDATYVISVSSSCDIVRNTISVHVQMGTESSKCFLS